MKDKIEHQYFVFNIEDGPKVINETLNTYGAEGWQLSTMITIAGGTKIVAWMLKVDHIETPDAKKSTESKIASLWSGDKEE